MYEERGRRGRRVRKRLPADPKVVRVVQNEREIEKFIIRQPPTGEKDDYDGENSWISDGLPSSFLKHFLKLKLFPRDPT